MRLTIRQAMSRLKWPGRSRSSTPTEVAASETFWRVKIRIFEARQPMSSAEALDTVKSSTRTCDQVDESVLRRHFVEDRIATVVSVTGFARVFCASLQIHQMLRFALSLFRLIGE